MHSARVSAALGRGLLAAHLLAASARATSLYSTYSFNPLEHLAGITPSFEPRDPPTLPSPPFGCTPARAALLVRHAAIYMNDFDYEESIEPFLRKLERHGDIDWSRIPGLNFLAGWTPPFADADMEMLTRVGKLEAAQLGTSLSFRYPGLRLPRAVWTSSAERTVQSARSLARGLETADGSIGVTVVDEGKEAGADSLTPYHSCPAFDPSAGTEQSRTHRDRFVRPVLARLNALAPAFGFNATDVMGMMELCGYESVVRGASPFCRPDLFSPDDWLGWEYAADIQYHYNMGYGSPVAGAVGFPWLNATAALLLADGGNAAARDLYVSFTHRELPPMVAVAMGLFNNSDFGGTAEGINATMPADRINHRRAWKASHILPFLANIAVERLNCSTATGFEGGDYFRVLVNNAPQELPTCADGPGTSCSRRRFQEYLQERGDLFSGFSEKCRVKYKNSTDVLSIYNS